MTSSFWRTFTKHKYIQNVYDLRNAKFVSIKNVGHVRVHNVKDYSVQYSGSTGIRYWK